MPDADTELHDLIRDAERVRAYAARAGLLTDDRLSQAIRTAREGGGSADVSELATALSDAVKAISPMTLVDLRDGRSPFDPASEKTATRLQFFLSTFTLLLVGMIGSYMVQMKREQDVVVMIESTADQRLSEKVGVLRKMVQYEDVFQNGDIKYDNYRQKLVELKQLHQRISSFYPMLMEVEGTSNVPFAPVFNLASKWLEKLAGLTAPNDGQDVAAVNPGSTSEANSEDRCAVDPVELIKNKTWLSKVQMDQHLDFCFSSTALGSSDLYWGNAPLMMNVPRVKDSIALKSAWILPFLYGLLGASIYLMRSQLNTRTAAITWMPAFLRIALGGVAGIVIGWFSGSGVATAMVAVAPSSLPFALAFLAGFSIEVLFSLLDRFNRAITEQTRPKGVD